MDDHAAPGLDLEVLGTHFRVRTRWEATSAALALQWSRCLSSQHPDAIEVDAADAEAFPERDGYLLASQLTMRAIEHAIGSRLMFHAAGLATDDGEVIALIAPSGTGKTTAALTLCRESFGYVTDETVSVGVEGEPDVLPYPKPLSIVRDGVPGAAKSQHGPDGLGLRPAAAPLWLARLVLLDRREEVTEPSLTPVALIDGMIEAAQQISALARLRDPLQVLCRTAEHCLGIFRLSYDDIGATGGVLSALISAPPDRDAEPWWPWHPEGRPEHWSDAVRVGPEALVLLGAVPVRLGPVGCTALEVLLLGGDEADVLAATTDLYGPHPQAPTLVAAAIATIRDTGLLPGA